MSIHVETLGKDADAIVYRYAASRLSHLLKRTITTEELHYSTPRKVYNLKLNISQNIQPQTTGELLVSNFSDFIVWAGWSMHILDKDKETPLGIIDLSQDPKTERLRFSRITIGPLAVWSCERMNSFAPTLQKMEQVYDIRTLRLPVFQLEAIWFRSEISPNGDWVAIHPSEVSVNFSKEDIKTNPILKDIKSDMVIKLSQYIDYVNDVKSARFRFTKHEKRI